MELESEAFGPEAAEIESDIGAEPAEPLALPEVMDDLAIEEATEPAIDTPVSSEPADEITSEATEEFDALNPDLASQDTSELTSEVASELPPEVVDPKEWGRYAHRVWQEDWIDQMGGGAESEKTLENGRADLVADLGGNEKVLGEFKTTDFESKSYGSDAAFFRLLQEHADQVDRYRDSSDFNGQTVNSFIEYQNRPTDPERVAAIEQEFGSRGIPVLWSDQTNSLGRVTA